MRPSLPSVRRLFASPPTRAAVIGTEATEALERELPADASRADHERIVVVSRETLIRAKADIPDA
ncbi:hypothetical protein [Streptomyces sennicomposti]